MTAICGLHAAWSTDSVLDSPRRPASAHQCGRTHTTTSDNCKAENCYVTMERLSIQHPSCKPMAAVGGADQKLAEVPNVSVLI